MSGRVERKMAWSSMQVLIFISVSLHIAVASSSPKPTPWPEQFHALLYQNYSGKLSMIDLWYDYPKGRNFNIIHKQLGTTTYDLEWTNGTSFYYDLEAKSCRTMHFPVGILTPDWLVENSTYLGVKEVNGFVCNVWSKADDFIVYYEDVQTKRPVHWLFFTGMSQHVMTFEVGKVLEDEKWQAPVYCFGDNVNKLEDNGFTPHQHSLLKGL